MDSVDPGREMFEQLPYAVMTPPQTRSEVIGIRATPQQKSDIGRRAKRHGMTVSEYMIASSLGEVVDPKRLEQRVAELERRLDALDGSQ